MTNIKIGHTCMSQQNHNCVPFHFICKGKLIRGLWFNFITLYLGCLEWKPEFESLWPLLCQHCFMNTLSLSFGLHFISLWIESMNKSNFNCHQPTPHTTYILLKVSIKVKCLVLHCSKPNWNETSELIDMHVLVYTKTSMYIHACLGKYIDMHTFICMIYHDIHVYTCISVLIHDYACI
jgi:hypothetical protein